MRRILVAALALGVLLHGPVRVLAGGAAEERSEIDPKYQWNLTDLYPNTSDWEADFARAEAMIPEVAAYQGRLGGSAAALLEFRGKSEALSEIYTRLLIYSGLKSDEDARISENKGLRDRVRALGVRLESALAWTEPELIAIPRERVERFMEEEPDLAVYRHFFDDLRRKQEHVLSEGEEKILSLSGDLAGVPRDVYNQFANADLRFGAFTDENGDEVEMTEGRFGLYLRSPNRKVREEAFRVYYEGYGKYLHTSAAALAGAMKRDLFYTRARGYDTCVEMALDGDNVPTEVLENLIATVGDHMEPVKKYNRIRKRVLELDTLRHWDTYAPLMPSVDRIIPYEEGVATIEAGLSPLGEGYVEKLKRGFGGGWIDVYENVGKRSGAYSWGSYATPHPYILMNYQGTMRDMFTLAHEMGHCLHTMHAAAAQPPVYADYTLFVAEVASTTNEALLMDHLLKNTDDREMRIYLINYWIKQILNTVYTQVMFSEFEWRIHEMLEKGEPLTVDAMNGVYMELLDKYAGGEVAFADESAIGWARIHHFYRNFYVYKYATGYVAATAIARSILGGEPGARERYIAFLESGSNDYPIELLKKAGVDLTRPDPVEATCELLASLVDELDELLKKG
ncbi:MAG: oligoendopeptidase F [Candidatus Eisenbacteria bacterium]